MDERVKEFERKEFLCDLMYAIEFFGQILLILLVIGATCWGVASGHWLIGAFIVFVLAICHGVLLNWTESRFDLFR